MQDHRQYFDFCQLSQARIATHRSRSSGIRTLIFVEASLGVPKIGRSDLGPRQPRPAPTSLDSIVLNEKLTLSAPEGHTGRVRTKNWTQALPLIPRNQ